tara:strand:- start:373 stop:1212 length:840 start_codon:yes stop_codon:yes gene_type:complete
MKKYTDFRSEQIHINEIGPVGATIAAVTGLIGGAFALKKGLDKYKGYKESQKEKKANKKGFVVNVKRFNPETGELEDRKEVVRGKKVDNDGVEKLRKKMQKDADIENAGLEADFIDSGGPERVAKQKDQEQEPPEEKPENPEQELRSKGDKDPKDGGITSDKEANDYKKLTGKAPRGWRTFKYKSGASELRMNKEDKVLKFGEFIQEDVVSDLKKISKSKKDMEIKLGDGSEIPIDPMTADIFVKYIEGLKSSEQKRVINQIQRTERGFMKVLGKAHGE